MRQKFTNTSRSRSHAQSIGSVLAITVVVGCTRQPARQQNCASAFEVSRPGKIDIRLPNVGAGKYCLYFYPVQPERRAELQTIRSVVSVSVTDKSGFPLASASGVLEPFDEVSREYTPSPWHSEDSGAAYWANGASHILVPAAPITLHVVVEVESSPPLGIMLRPCLVPWVPTRTP